MCHFSVNTCWYSKLSIILLLVLELYSAVNNVVMSNLPFKLLGATRKTRLVFHPDLCSNKDYNEVSAPATNEPCQRKPVLLGGNMRKQSRRSAAQ